MFQINEIILHHTGCSARVVEQDLTRYGFLSTRRFIKQETDHLGAYKYMYEFLHSVHSMHTVRSEKESGVYYIPKGRWVL